MAATGTLTITGNVSNVSGNAQITIGPATVTSATANAYSATVALSVGANTITLPSSLTELVIVGPNGANPIPNPVVSTVLTLKGVSGDTGVGISAKYATALTWDAGQSPSTIVINSTAVCSIQLWGF